MANGWRLLVGTSSVVLRLSAFAFLRWIPGHHFPRTILSALVVYLSTVYFKPDCFNAAGPRELLPALSIHEETVNTDNGQNEEVDIEIYYDEPIFYQDEHPLLKTLLCGIPDWREKTLSYFTIGLNILLSLLTLDLVFRGPLLYAGDELRFTRVGFVDSTTARILVREPDPQLLPAYTYYKSEYEEDWTQADKIYYVGPESDFTRPIYLTGLRPETAYTYTVSNNLTGSFTTAPTAGSPASGSLVFLTSSCIKANFPYRPFSHSLAIHGFEHLSALITSLRTKPAFMLFLGDFIYVDVPQRLSSTINHYRSEYRRVYQSPSWQLPGIKSIPWLHTLDDHEIANDWSGGNTTSPFPEASDPFIHYHVSINPPIPSTAPSGSDTNTTYFQFTRGPASFFLLDTRRYRTDPESNTTPNVSSKPLYGSSSSSSNPALPHQHATMLGYAQLGDLLRFLSQPEPKGVYWKIIASSVPFTKNWRFGTSDTWGGFLRERSIILEAMHRAEHDLGVRVIVLSGDRHEFAAIRFPSRIQSIPTNRGTLQQPDQLGPDAYDTTPQSGPHEFSVGPLSMFYLPFRTFKQIDGQDVALAYFPDGNSKIGVVEIGNMAGGMSGASAGASKRGRSGKVNDGVSQKSWLKYSLYIDGEVKWEYMLMSPGLSS